jgi:hypothetical protein
MPAPILPTVAGGDGCKSKTIASRTLPTPIAENLKRSHSPERQIEDERPTIEELNTQAKKVKYSQLAMSG